MGISWPCQKQHPGPQSVVLRCCWSTSASRHRPAAGGEGHSPTALLGTIWDGAQGGSAMGFSHFPSQSVPFLPSCRQQG